MKPACPRCQVPMLPEDIDVHRDLARCTQCSESFFLSAMLGPPDKKNAVFSLESPPPGVRIEHDGDTTRVRASTRMLQAFIVIGPMAALLIAMTFLRPFHTQGPFGMGMYSFIWLLLIVNGTMLVAGHVEVEFGPRGGRIFAGVGRLGRRRTFKPGAVRAVRCSFVPPTKMTENFAIQIETDRKHNFGRILFNPRRVGMALALRSLLAPSPETDPGDHRPLPPCPSCGTPIPWSDASMATDAALCRACGSAMKLSDVTDTDQIRTLEAPPPRGVWLDNENGVIRIGASSRSMKKFWPLLFLWFMSLVLLVIPVTSPAIQSVMSAVLLFAGFLLLVLLISLVLLQSLWGRVEITLRGGEGSLYRGIGRVGVTTLFDSMSVTDIREGDSWLHVEGQALKQIELVAGRRLRFGMGLDEAKRRYMLAALRRLLLPLPGQT